MLENNVIWLTMFINWDYTVILIIRYMCIHCKFWYPCNIYNCSPHIYSVDMVMVCICTTETQQYAFILGRMICLHIILTVLNRQFDFDNGYGSNGTLLNFVKYCTKDNLWKQLVRSCFTESSHIWYYCLPYWNTILIQLF